MAGAILEELIVGSKLIRRNAGGGISCQHWRNCAVLGGRETGWPRGPVAARFLGFAATADGQAPASSSGSARDEAAVRAALSTFYRGMLTTPR